MSRYRRNITGLYFVCRIMLSNIVTQGIDSE